MSKDKDFDVNDVLNKYGIKKSKDGVVKPVVIHGELPPKRLRKKQTHEEKVVKEIKKNPSRRYIGKIKEIEGKFGPFETIVVDNPKDESEWHKGQLIWKDKETGESFLVKAINVAGIDEKSKAHGFTNSLRIDLDNDYLVEKL